MPASTELRHDALSGQLAIVAAGRAARPHTVAHEAPELDAGPEHCPFCAGHETMTPPEVCRTGEGAPDTAGWRVRVVPNLYPIVGDAGAGPGATGVHEVVILCPDHRRSFGALDDDQAIEVFRVLRDRTAAHIGQGHAFAMALLNHRRAAGASIAHPHAQVVALDFVPPEAHAAAIRADDAGTDLLAGDVDDARVHGTVLLDRRATAWFPFAGGSPFVVRVADPTAGARFDDAADAIVDGVAVSARDAIAALAEALGDPPYNLTVHTAAADGTGPRRWYVEITPRLSVVAGFEMGTGVLVNTTPPEQAVALVRDRDA